MKKRTGGSESFESFYKSCHGERWEKLKKAFSEEPDYIEITGSLRESGPQLKPYYMDRASLFPVCALDAGPGQKVLDMCAAPGGKTLLIAFSAGGEAEITTNDRSRERRGRLAAVISSSLPPELRRGIRITGHDASRWGMHEKDTYDRILLDAPCSSERHVFNSPRHLEEWGPARTRQLAARQYAMLVSALDAAKPGGRIVYSTCSISPEENDNVVERLIKKRKTVFFPEENISGEQLAEKLPQNISMQERAQVNIEKTVYGFQIMPDINRGAGPIYFSVIIKM